MSAGVDFPIAPQRQSAVLENDDQREVDGADGRSNALWIIERLDATVEGPEGLRLKPFRGMDQGIVYRDIQPR